MKYGNKKTVVGGIEFDSKAEARRWQELCLLHRAGEVRELRRQVVYVLAPGVKFLDAKRSQPALRYIADFHYFDVRLDRYVCEDVKGVLTALFRVKRHLMATVHGIDILVTA